MGEAKKLYIKTYGCQMNVYDSERMAEALGGQGYVETATPDDADMILLNPCHIREKAAEKVYSELGRFKGLKAERPDLKIGVAGCVAQAEGEEIMRRQPMVDLVVGPQSYHNLPALEAKARGGAKALDTQFPLDDKFDTLRKRGGKAKRGPRMPPELVGMAYMTDRDEPICFAYNLDGCDKADSGERCPRGLHVCARPGCFKAHSQKDHV